MVLVPINRQCRDPETWTGAIFAFDSRLSVMVFEEGENAYFYFESGERWPNVAG